MAQMRIAAGAMHLGPCHEKPPVHRFFDLCGVDGLIKRRPAGAAFEFGVLVEQGRATADAQIGAVILGEIVMRSGPFGAMFARDLKGQIGQLCAPFGIRLDDFIHVIFLFHPLGIR